MPINQNAPSLDELKRQILMLHLAKIRGGMDPGRQEVLDKRQQGREDLATMGQFAAGMDEAAARMGGFKPSTQIPAQARTFESRAAAGRKALDSGSGLGLDPKVFSHLKALKGATGADKLTYGPGEFDPKTRETRKYKRTPSGEKMGEGVLTGSKAFEVENAHWNKYRSDPVTKKTDLLAVNYQKIKNANENPSPAGDISLIFGFMKMIDPTSTVREGEFATAANAGSVPTRVWGLYNKILEGERLTDDQRADFTNQALLIWQAQYKLQVQVDKRYSDHAAANNFNFKPFTWDVEGSVSRKAPKGDSGEIPIPEDIKNMSDEELRKAAGE